MVIRVPNRNILSKIAGGDLQGIRFFEDIGAALFEGGISAAWVDITGKPVVFPPSAHSHVIADTTGLPAALTGKQDVLVSGGNIKTVNGISLLGAGNLATGGWGAYFNTAAAQALTANIQVTLTNNAATAIETQKPTDITTFYNGTAIAGRDGDGVAIGIEFTFTPSSALASIISVSIDIGGAVGELYLHEYPVLRGSGVAQKVSYNIAAYMLNTWQTNGGLVKVLCDGPGSITAVRYVIQRLHKAVP